MTTSATRQEQRVVTQEVRATSTVLSGNENQVRIPIGYLQEIFARIGRSDQVEGPFDWRTVNT